MGQKGRIGVRVGGEGTMRSRDGKSWMGIWMRDMDEGLDRLRWNRP